MSPWPTHSFLLLLYSSFQRLLWTVIDEKQQSLHDQLRSFHFAQLRVLVDLTQSGRGLDTVRLPTSHIRPRCFNRKKASHLFGRHLPSCCSRRGPPYKSLNPWISVLSPAAGSSPAQELTSSSASCGNIYLRLRGKIPQVFAAFLSPRLSLSAAAMWVRMGAAAHRLWPGVPPPTFPLLTPRFVGGGRSFFSPKFRKGKCHKTPVVSLETVRCQLISRN